jgi:hypothetical protein
VSRRCNRQRRASHPRVLPWRRPEPRGLGHRARRRSTKPCSGRSGRGTSGTCDPTSVADVVVDGVGHRRVRRAQDSVARALGATPGRRAKLLFGLKPRHGSGDLAEARTGTQACRTAAACLGASLYPVPSDTRLQPERGLASSRSHPQFSKIDPHDGSVQRVTRPRKRARAELQSPSHVAEPVRTPTALFLWLKPEACSLKPVAS